MVARIGSGNIPVLGAINGDFFSMQTGVPLGVMISGGKLVSTDDGKYSIGFSKTRDRRRSASRAYIST